MAISKQDIFSPIEEKSVLKQKPSSYLVENSSYFLYKSQITLSRFPKHGRHLESETTIRFSSLLKKTL